VVAGLLGVGAILLIKSVTRIKEDAALGIVLSVSFGLGVALLGVIQKMPTGNQAGLESFIYGKTASMLRSDAIMIGLTALLVVGACLTLYKEFAILSFDASYASAQGWPTARLDLAMMVLVTGVTVIGLQAVGLILIIAMLIIPAAAARFWTDHLRSMLVIAGLIGAASGFIGAAWSALLRDLPAGAIIVVVAATIFAISLVIGRRRGVLVRVLAHRRLERSVAAQHLLRAVFEWLEGRGGLDAPEREAMPRRALLAARAWSPAALSTATRRARRRGRVTVNADGAVALTDDGLAAAARCARNHRLWEIYLITHADIAPSHVDRDADQIEHVLGPALVRELEAALAAAPPIDHVPPSPHRLSVAGAGGAP